MIAPRVIVLAVLTLFIPATAAWASGLSERLAILDAWLADQVARREQPGLSIGVVQDGALIWTASYGQADVENAIPATSTTVYRIGSVSKVFTAITVMQLRDAGRLQLDDAVSKHLPWFRVKNTFPDAPPITIRHLLTHSSGLPSDTPGVDWNTYTGLPEDEVIARVADVEPVFPPGEHTYYSNFGYWIVGQIVESLSGKPLAQVVKDKVLIPLGMSATDLEPGADTPGLAIGYRSRRPGQPREAWPFTDTRFYTPAGDGASSIEDMVRLIALFMGEGPEGEARILTPSTLEEMQGERPAPDAEDWRGLGLGVRVVGDRIAIGHGGDGGGFEASFGVIPDARLGVVVLTNADDGSPTMFRDTAFKILAYKPHRQEQAAASPSDAAARPPLERYAGDYGTFELPIAARMLDGQLILLVPRARNPLDTIGALRPLGDHAFRMLEIDGRYGEVVRFAVDEDGRATALHYPNWDAPRK